MITIRQEESTDWAEVKKVIEEAFATMTMSDHREHFLVDRLRHSEYFIPELSLVAVNAEGNIVGHVMPTKVNLETADCKEEILALAPLSVHPPFQRQGIGTSLIKEAESIAHRLGYKYIAILGDPTYYGKFGYKRASDYRIKFSIDAPEEYCLIKEIISDGIKEEAATLVYPDVFFQ